jgi:hypothetical protein
MRLNQHSVGITVLIKHYMTRNKTPRALLNAAVHNDRALACKSIPEVPHLSAQATDADTRHQLKALGVAAARCAVYMA